MRDGPGVVGIKGQEFVAQLCSVLESHHHGFLPVSSAELPLELHSSSIFINYEKTKVHHFLT